jgi:hypothetical protein
MSRNCSLLALVGCFALTLSGCSDRGDANDVATASEPADVTPEADSTADTPADDETLDQFCGTWQLEDNGLRTVWLNPDGTARMHVELDFIASLIYGEEMMMNLTWSIDDGVLSYTIVGGQPVESVDKVILNYGRERSYRILTISDDCIQLEDMDSPGKIHDWMNVGDAPGQG